MSASGLVTGVSVGAVSITAQVESITEDVTINVTPKPVASVGVEPAQATIPVGGTQQLVATPRDAQGQPLQGRPVTFQSDNPAGGSVSTTGLVTAVSTGNHDVRATSEGRIRHQRDHRHAAARVAARLHHAAGEWCRGPGPGDDPRRGAGRTGWHHS